jgi:hypothetical protein
MCTTDEGITVLDATTIASFDSKVNWLFNYMFADGVLEPLGNNQVSFLKFMSILNILANYCPQVD